MKPKKRKELYALIEQWTRCEIIARLSPIGWPDCGDYHFQMLEKQNQIRELMFGSSNLLELGERWNILPKIEERKKHERQRKNRQKS